MKKMMMNQASKKFFTITILLVIVPVLIAMLSFDKMKAQDFRPIPNDVEALLNEKILNIETQASGQNGNLLIEKKLVSYLYSETNESDIHDLIYEYEYSEYFMKYSIRIIKTGKSYDVDDMHVERSETAFYPSNHFTLLDKTPLHYMFFTLLLMLLIFTVYSAALCYGRTPRDKWKRSIITLTGVGTILFDWHTADVSYHMMSIAIPTVSINYGANYSVFSLAFHLPIGLFIYWLLWHKENVTEITIKEGVYYESKN